VPDLKSMKKTPAADYQYHSNIRYKIYRVG
jgi:hypothetical protein